MWGPIKSGVAGASGEADKGGLLALHWLLISNTHHVRRRELEGLVSCQQSLQDGGILDAARMGADGGCILGGFGGGWSDQ